MKILLRLFAIALWLSPGLAFAQSTALPVVPGFNSTTGCTPPGLSVCFIQFGASFNATGSTTLSAGVTSTNTPLVGAGTTVLITNNSAVPAFVALGGSGVVATTSSTPVIQNYPIVLQRGSATTIAGITASSSTTLTIVTGNGIPASIPAGGSSSGGGGGGGAVTLASGAVASGAYSSGSIASGAYVAGSISDGASINLGTLADTAWGLTGNGTLTAIAKETALLINGPTPAGTNIIGKVGVDQTTPGTTNAVSLQIGSAAPSLTNPIWTANAEAADVTGTFTNATQTTSITNSAADGYANGLLSINGTYATASGVFEASDDGGTTYYPIACIRSDGAVSETGYTSLTNTSRQWSCTVGGNDSVRIRSTAVATGTVNARVGVTAPPSGAGATLMNTALPPLATADAANLATIATNSGLPIPAGTSLIGKVGIDQTTPGTTNGVVVNATATPIGGAAVAIATGGTAVSAVAANAKGCIIQNPLTTTDQGIGTVEPLYISQVTTALTAGNVSTFALAPGQTYNCIPGSTLAVSVNAATSAHKFAVTSW